MPTEPDHDDDTLQPPPEVTPKAGDPYEGIDALTGVPPIPADDDTADPD